MRGSRQAYNEDRMRRDPAPPWLADDRAPQQIERDIRARERQTIRWLREKPWLQGRGLAATVAACRRRHTESIARDRP